MNPILLIMLMGIVAGILLKNTILILIISLMSIVSILVLNLKKRKYSIYVITFFISLILSLFRTSFEEEVKLDIGENYRITGEIVEILNNDEDYQKFFIETESINGVKTSQKLMLTYSNENSISLYDNIDANIKISNISSYDNFGMYSYKTYLNSKSIYNYGKVSEILSMNQTNSLLKSIKLKAVESISNVFDKHLSETNSVFMKRLILSDKIVKNNELIELYKDYGLTHLIAISGLHIGIIAVFLSKTLSKLRFKYKFKSVLIVIILFVYGHIIDFPSSAIRAIIMYIVYEISVTTKHKYNFYNSLMFTMIVMLLINPNWLHDTGFQLSCLAVLSIYSLSPSIKRVVNHRLRKYDFGITTILSAAIGLLPIQMLYFGEFNPLSIIANILIIPIISIVIMLTFIVLSINLIKVNVIVIIMFWIINTLLDFTNIVLDTLSIFHISSITVGFSMFSSIIYYVALITILNIKRLFTTKTTNYYILGTIICSMLMVLIGFQREALYIEFLDVGQGDSALISYKDKHFLVDTGGNTYGNFNPGEKITCPIIKKRGISSIDIVFLSHFDLDHSNGVDALIENNLAESFGISYKDDSSAIYNSIVKSKLPVYFLKSGDSIDVENKLVFEVISPDSNYNSSDDNELSLVMNLKYNGYNILFTGDIDSKVEESISDTIGEIDILKVSHHGSKYSTSEDFLEITKPDYGVISVGRNNYSHPTEETLNRLHNSNVRIYRTDLDGGILVKIDKNINISTVKDGKLYRDIDYDTILEILLIALLNSVGVILIKEQKEGKIIDEPLRFS
ncbi:MAG: DNA internalization-related competence protein ComEC/Rec2 [Tissierellia bacterium]|nr:DNA internalization-related competence protein ComEC/Rec2 [Tissierellia bacterium]